VLKLAVPLLLRGLVPNAVPPSRKVTVPVAPEGATVAVRFTVWPKFEVVGDTDRVVVVVGRPTDTTAPGEVLPMKLLSPL
jgi:hypothetical protein